MSREVSYADQTLQSPNPIVRFAHRTRYQVSLDLADRLLPQHGSLCDFGAGEGTFLRQFGMRRPEARLIAIEPFMTMTAPGMTRVATAAELQPASIDLITAFEALEHLTDDLLAAFLDDAARALRPDGTLLITVPVMYGAMLPIKEISRALLHRRLGDTSPSDLMRATLGRPIARAPDRLTSHRGFDFRDLQARVAHAFDIAETSRSPFARLPWWLNSQAIIVARRRG